MRLLSAAAAVSLSLIGSCTVDRTAPSKRGSSARAQREAPSSAAPGAASASSSGAGNGNHPEDDAARLVGTWSLDVAKVRSEIEAKRATGGPKAALGAAMMAAMKPSFTFDSDGTYRVTYRDPRGDGTPGEKSGTYVVTTVDGPEMKVRTVDQEGSEETIILRFSGDDRAVLRKEGSGDLAMPLERG
jgi:hypothetical protein